MFFLFALFTDELEVFLPKYSQTAIIHAAHFRRVVNVHPHTVSRETSPNQNDFQWLPSNRRRFTRTVSGGWQSKTPPTPWHCNASFSVCSRAVGRTVKTGPISALISRAADFPRKPLVVVCLWRSISQVGQALLLLCLAWDDASFAWFALSTPFLSPQRPKSHS